MYFRVLLAMIVAAVITIPVASCSSCGDTIVSEGPFQIKLINEDGSDLTDPLFGNSIFYWDTYTDSQVVQFTLKALVTLDLIPARLVVLSDSGLFNIEVSINGLKSTFFEETGLRISLVSSDNVFHADLYSSNNFESFFVDELGIVSQFNPNDYYYLSMSTIDGSSTSIAPQDVTNITITFEATIGSGFHQVVFISEGKVISSSIMPDGAVIYDVPVVVRSGYSFQGWYTPDGKLIESGYTICADDGDIIAYAKWIPSEGGQIFLFIGAGGSVAAISLLALLLLAKKRKNDQTS